MEEIALPSWVAVTLASSALAIAQALNLVDDRNLRVSRLSEIAMQRMR